MSLTLDHKASPRPVAELPEQQIALANIETPIGLGQMMVIKIEGRLLAYHGGRPVRYSVSGWLPMQERR